MASRVACENRTATWGPHTAMQPVEHSEISKRPIGHGLGASQAGPRFLPPECRRGRSPSWGAYEEAVNLVVPQGEPELAARLRSLSLRFAIENTTEVA
jgi:hypothetical protein